MCGGVGWGVVMPCSRVCAEVFFLQPISGLKLQRSQSSFLPSLFPSSRKYLVNVYYLVQALRIKK